MGKDSTEPRLPIQQLSILALCRFAEPVVATSINPYIPEMIQSFGIPIDQVAKYSGWLAACFSVSQCLTAIFWGRASDSLGRKPMIIAALTLIMISSIMFGFSSSIAMAFVARSIQGLSSGNVGIIRTAVAEMVPQRELQPRAFSIMPLVWNIGSIFGPSLGGGLVKPVERYPELFKKWTLLKKYPFALPNLLISVLFLVGITSGALFFHETHAEHKHRRDCGLILGRLFTRSCTKRTRSRRESASPGEDEPFLDDEEPNHFKSKVAESSKAMWASVFTYQSNVNLIAYTGLAMHSIAFDQILPVFLNYPTNTKLALPVQPPFRFAGGFGLDSSRIGLLFTIYGFFGMLIQFLVFPPVAKKFGVLRCFKACVLTFPFVYILVPFTSLIKDDTAKQLVLVLLMLVKCFAGIFSFPCSTILLTNSAASLKVLGTLNGVSTSVSALGRGAGPALVGATFTLGVEAGYILVPFWVLAILAVIAAIPVWWLVEMDGFSAKIETPNEEETIVDSDDDLEPEVVTGVVGLGVSGTEEADLVAEQMPYQNAKILKGSQRHGRRNSYSMKKVTSPVVVNPEIDRIGENILSNDNDTTRATTIPE